MLALTPKVHVKKKKIWWYLLAAPVSGEAETGKSPTRRLLASHASLLGEFQSSVRFH